jgi:hypothetical protein
MCSVPALYFLQYFPTKYFAFLCFMWYNINRSVFMENLIFDYKSLGEDLAIPVEIIKKFEKEARNEFPFDNMLMEIHVLRAMKNYAKQIHG